ncbi:hypothetical protein ZYGR_0BA01270 [Zygosaccharomyces rouxii]|uniref:Protein yippee-like n=1 Tax=Zygosaccharomyces rouxii TaxID=4956 RepID=A0A1Q3AKI6_ZYGRO|nr:hypothetical protein ZYGR_0BA01270 [Zygosaccharomyces rouxii]
MGLRYSSYIESPISAEDGFNSTGGSVNIHQRSSSSYPYHYHMRHREHAPPKFITYGCRCCRTHLSSSSQIMSKDYRGKTGDAYLMSKLVNVIDGNIETRPMITGDYLVCDVLCHWCKSLVGWKYLESERKDQRYKEGKYIMELQTVCRCG